MIKLLPILTLFLLTIKVLAQSPIVAMQFKEDNAVFCDITYNNNEGVLLSGIQLDGKDLILIYLDKNLNRKWKVKIDNNDIGYIDPSVNNNEIHAFFFENEVFIYYQPLNIYGKNNCYFIKINSSGEIEKSVYSLKEGTRVHYPYFYKNNLRLLLSYKTSVRITEYISLTYNPGGQFEENIITFPKESLGSPYWTGNEFYFHAFNGGYKGKNKILSYFTKNQHNGQPYFLKNISIDFDEAVVPCPDIEAGYGSSRSYTFHDSPLSRLRIRSDMNLYYGMYSKDSDLYTKDGFYLIEFTPEWEIKFKKVYSFKSLETKYPEFKLLSGKKMFTTDFYTKGNYHFYILKNFVKEEAVIIILSLTGDIVDVSPVKFKSLRGKHKYCLYLNGNSDYVTALSSVFTQPKGVKLLGINDKLKAMINNAVESDKCVNLITVGDKDYVVKYDSNEESVQIYGNN